MITHVSCLAFAVPYDEISFLHGIFHTVGIYEGVADGFRDVFGRFFWYSKKEDTDPFTFAHLGGRPVPVHKTRVARTGGL